MSEIIFKGPDGYVGPISFVKLYSDGTPMVKADIEELAAFADTLVLRPHSLNTFVTAMFLVDAISHKGGKIRKLVLPYVPGARQDRINPTGDVLFTLSSVAGMINVRDFSRVIILDPHSPVTPAWINRSMQFPLSKIAELLPDIYDGVIAPDKGAKHRSNIFAAVHDKPLFFASKNRDVSTGKITGFELEYIPPGHYLVADDICDGGGTFIGLGEKIREQGATADLYVTHGIFSKGTIALKRFYKNIYTTDSREIHERNDAMFLPIVKEMENYND